MPGPVRRRIVRLALLSLAGAGALGLLAPPAPAGGEAASAWSASFHARARLVAAGGAAGEDRLAGVEIALDPGFKTYWRHPGDSGLPPVFDWSASRNLKSAEVAWPAPHRFPDGSGYAAGYLGGVVLPVTVTPENPKRPVQLRLKLAYGVCREVCIPAEAQLALDLPAGPPRPSPHRGAVQAALARAPVPEAPGEGGDLAILSARPAPFDGHPGIEVLARAPAPAELFVEGPDGWQFSSPKTAAQTPGTTRFTARLQERAPAEAAAEVRLTLVAGERAVETAIRLDFGATPP